MDPLFEIPNLTALNIAGLKFSPDSVANVAMCANLKRINLSRCPSITPELLNALGSHEGFEALDLSAAHIEGPSIAPSLVVFKSGKYFVFLFIIIRRFSHASLIDPQSIEEARPCEHQN